MTTAQTRLSDVIVPEEFTAYQAENSVVSTALYQADVLVENEMAAQLQASAQSFLSGLLPIRFIKITAIHGEFN